MRSLVVAAIAFAGVSASADGFKFCEVTGGPDYVAQCKRNEKNCLEQISVFNHVSDGATRKPAVMIVANPTFNVGNRTAAKFTSWGCGLLSKIDGAYVANVDGSCSEANRGGENLYGTKLSQVKTMKLAINGSEYSRKNGQTAYGKLTIVKERGAGAALKFNVKCVRYKKTAAEEKIEIAQSQSMSQERFQIQQVDQATRQVEQTQQN